MDQITAEATQSIRNLNMIFCCPVPYCLERRVFFYLHAELKEHEEEHMNPQKPKKWGNKCYVCKADFVSERNRIIHNSICAARNGVSIEAFEMEEEEEQIVEVEEENPNMEEEGATGTKEIFFLGHTQRHIFRLKGPTHNRSMGFQNNWYYAL